MINLEIKNLTTLIQPALNRLTHYSGVLFIIGFLSVYAFLVMQVNVLVNSEPSTAEITQQTAGIKKLKIDQDALDKMLKLEAENIDVGALFNELRNNPFSE